MAQSEPIIANYDDQTAEEIKQRLRKLSQADLAKLEAYEKQGQARSTVLEAIAALRGDEPWSGYDDMEVEVVNDALKQRDGDTARGVVDYERHHKGRTTIIEFAKRRQEESDGASGSARSQSSRSSARPKQPASKRSSGTSGRGAASGTAARSTRGRSTKAAAGRTQGKTTSRPGATRSSGSQQAKGSQRRSRSQPSGASRRRAQSRKPSTTRPSQSESRAKEALRGVAAGLKERATEALRSAEGPTKRLATDTGHAVGSAAQAAPAKIRDRATEAMQSAEGSTRKRARETNQAVGSVARDGRTAVRGTGQAVAAAANKAKTPALVGAATLATVGGVVALGSKVKSRKTKRVLGIPVPRRTAVGNATKRVGKAVDSVSSTGQQIGRWSDDLQYLRQRIAGGDGTVEKLTDGGSAVSVEGRAGVTPRAVARRMLC